MGKNASHSLAVVQNGTPDVVHAMTVDSMSLPSNTQLTEDETGALYDTLIGIREVAPIMRAQTKNVATLLGLFGLGGGCLGAPPLNLDKLVQYYEGKTSCGSTSSQNLSYTVGAGVYRLDSLSARRGQDATLSMICDTLSADGSVAPVVQGQSAVLPTTVLTETFQMGIPEVAGLDMPDATSLTLAFNATLDEKLTGWGSVYPVDCGILKVRPEIRIENADIDMLKSAGVPLTGKDAVHADTLIPFRKKKNRGAFEDDAEEVHFSITASGLFYFDTIVSASGTSRATNTLVLRTVKESSTAPLVFSFDEAYAGT